MGNSIKEYVEERKIKFLVHFTRQSNLESILKNGLVPRNKLNLESLNKVNDPYRLDYTDAVSLSISFPNSQLFYRFRKTYQEDWVILRIKPDVLWELDCAFCRENAASSRVTDIQLEERKSLEAFKSMFQDFYSISRESLDIPDNYPTNPQAEVLILESVPNEYILGVIVNDKVKKEKLCFQYPNLDVRFIPDFFKYRSDWNYWKNEV